MIDWLKEPQNRVRAASHLFWLSITGWLLTHAFILITKPAGFTSWTAHLLLAISWLAIAFTAIDIVVTTDVRQEQDDER